jgi:hypothetical protein
VREFQGLDDGRVVHELPTDSRVQVWIYVAWILKGMHPDASYYELVHKTFITKNNAIVNLLLHMLVCL